jgi:hypothetical protein
LLLSTGATAEKLPESDEVVSEELLSEDELVGDVVPVVVPVVVPEVEAATVCDRASARCTPIPPTRRVEAASAPAVHRRARCRARGRVLIGGSFGGG